MKQLGTFPEAFSLTIYVRTSILFFSICQYKPPYQCRKSNIYPLPTIPPCRGSFDFRAGKENEMWVIARKKNKSETKSRAVHILWQALSTWSAGVVWRNYDRLVFTAPPKPTESCQVLRAASNGDLLIRHKDHGTQGQLSTDKARGRIEDEKREKEKERERGLYQALLMCSHPQTHKKAFILFHRKN